MPILAFDANAKLLNFTEKLNTARGKCRINLITWSFLPFAVLKVKVILNLSINGTMYHVSLVIPYKHFTLFWLFYIALHL